MLTTVIAILVTWYATKVYYTGSTVFKLSKFDTKDLMYVKCSKCALVATVHKDQLRVPFYCSSCK
jgi:hypothetical protein